MNCWETCKNTPFECPFCKRDCEPYDFDEETGEYIYKDLYQPIEDESEKEYYGYEANGIPKRNPPQYW